MNENTSSTKYDRFCLSLTESQIAAHLERKDPYVVRLKIPPGVTEFTDLVRGKMRFQHKLIDDQILLKSDGFPTYHFANVLDDRFMKISHVIRGTEWLASTPKHLLLYRAFGWEPPQFAHVPLVLNEDGSKVSKRAGDLSIESLKVSFFPFSNFDQAILSL